VISRLRRWFGIAPEPRQERVARTDEASRMPSGSAYGRDTGSGTGHVPAPDHRMITGLYVRNLFCAMDGQKAALTPAERHWLQARREQLRGDSSLSALVPRLPSAMPRLMAATRDPEKTSARELARLIESDPVLAANVLRVVNSPAMRLRRDDVESLEQAVVIMGFPGMREAIAAATISPIASFDRDPRFDAAALRQLWPHTLETAVAIRQAAARAGLAHGFDLYLAALSHSSGLMLLLRLLNALDEARPSPEFVDALDPLAKRCSVAIARGWGFPPRTVAVLEHWADKGADTAEAELLAGAVSFVRARALAGAGLLEADQWEALCRALPDHARDWQMRREDESEAPGSVNSA
jgi:HD-like signal output (HDOD) protein